MNIVVLALCWNGQTIMTKASEMMDDTNSPIAESLRRIAADIKANPLHSHIHIVPPNVDTYTLRGSLFDIEIMTSKFIEPVDGKILIVSKLPSPALRFKRIDLRKGEYLRADMYHALGLPDYFFDYNKKRYDDTWQVYLKRVPNALADPAIRWQYQKYILSAPARLARRLWSKLRESED